MASILSRLSPLLLIGLLAGCGPEKDDTGADDTGDTTTTQSPDRDGDGVTADADCDDYDPAVFPGAVDICNGIDDDCDEEIDEDPDVMWYADGDGDGFGDPADELGPSCEATSGYVANHADCDDGDATAFPGAIEECDGADNDCDGVADNGAALYVDPDGSASGTGSVDDPYGSIQAAVDAGAVCIAVRPGTYSENVEITGGPLWLFSEDGAEATVIDGGGSGTALIIDDTSGESYQVSGFTIQNGDASQNRDASDGGGLYVHGASVAFSDIKLVDNTADNYGGGGFLSEADVTFDGLEVSGNASDYGAGLYVDSSTLGIQGGSFAENEAYYGAGLLAAYSALDLTDCSFSGNAAYYDGGGFYIYETDMSLAGGEISGNEAAENGGGGLVSGGVVEISGVTVSGNSVSASDGGGLALSGGEVAISDSVITGNTSNSGGGGGVYVTGGSLELDKVEISGNSTSQGDGAGLAAWFGADVLATDVTIADNTTSYGYGGGFYLYYQSTFAGSGVTISGNSVGTSSGGGFAIDTSSDLSLEASSIRGNSASSFGGGDIDASSAVITSSVIASNDATYIGGLGVRNSGSLSLSNVILHSNSDRGTSTYGAALAALSDSDLSVSFSTIVDTAATYAITLQSSSSLELDNSILAYNNGYALYLSSTTATYLSGGHNAFWDNAYENVFYSDSAASRLEDDAVWEDPEFSSYAGDPDSDDLHLSSGSPCEDAGDPDQTDTDGSRADIGAYGGAGGDW